MEPEKALYKSIIFVPPNFTARSLACKTAACVTTSSELPHVHKPDGHVATDSSQDPEPFLLYADHSTSGIDFRNVTWN